MASIHLNKLHFACLALHPNPVLQRYMGYMTTQPFVHKTIWWFLTPVKFEFWTGMQNSCNISSFSASGFPRAAYFSTSADRLRRIFFYDNLVTGATTLRTCSGPVFSTTFGREKYYEKGITRFTGWVMCIQSLWMWRCSLVPCTPLQDLIHPDESPMYTLYCYRFSYRSVHQCLRISCKVVRRIFSSHPRFHHENRGSTSAFHLGVQDPSVAYREARLHLHIQSERMHLIQPVDENMYNHCWRYRGAVAFVEYIARSLQISLVDLQLIFCCNFSLPGFPDVGCVTELNQGTT